MGLIPDLGAALSGALGLGASGDQQNATPRAPFVFTSTLRLVTARTGAALSRGLSESQIANLVGASVADFERAFPSIRTSAFMPTIAMLVNPNSVKFTQPKRFVKKDTRDGSVFFHFTNSKGQNNDILTIAFSGNTGNLDLRGSLGGTNPDGSPIEEGGPDTGALKKLIVWHNLYLLSREPMLLADNTENVFTITYASKTFPIQLDFNGFFSKVLDFEENARKPNSLDYSFEFTVTSTEPDLDEWLSLLGDVIATPPGINEAAIDTAAAVGTAEGTNQLRNINSVVGPEGMIITA